MERACRGKDLEGATAALDAGEEENLCIGLTYGTQATHDGIVRVRHGRPSQHHPCEMPSPIPRSWTTPPPPSSPYGYALAVLILVGVDVSGVALHETTSWEGQERRGGELLPSRSPYRKVTAILRSLGEAVMPHARVARRAKSCLCLTGLHGISFRKKNSWIRYTRLAGVVWPFALWPLRHESGRLDSTSIDGRGVDEVRMAHLSPGLGPLFFLRP